MERHERITGRESIRRTLARGREQTHQRINHHVSDAMDFFRGDAFAQEIFVTVF